MWRRGANASDAKREVGAELLETLASYNRGTTRGQNRGTPPCPALIRIKSEPTGFEEGCNSHVNEYADSETLSRKRDVSNISGHPTDGDFVSGEKYMRIRSR